MPGIFGIASKKAAQEIAGEMQVMLACMKHEQFYNTGLYENSAMGIHAGWLSHPGSFSDCMPVRNEKGDIILILGGENFAEKETLTLLQNKGHVFDPGNASYLVHLYEEYGENRFFNELNGLFSGLLIDVRNERVFLFNDRCGMQRIYYHSNPEEFIFASEAKAILKIRPDLRRIDMRSLGEFFTCGCPLENRTLFSGIYLLPAASAWHISNAKALEKRTYFNPQDFESQEPLDQETFYKSLRQTFVKVLPKYFEAKQAIGMSLTGGIDTRMILACRENPPDSLPCYTFGSIFRDCYDVSIAREVAAVCRQKYHVLSLGQEFLSRFPDYASKSAYITEGALEVTSSYELYLNNLARTIAPIRMTGNYGSEVLRSVGALRAFYPDTTLFDPDFTAEFDRAVKTLHSATDGNKLPVLLSKRIPWQMNGRSILEQTQLTLRTPFLDKELVRLMFRAPVQARTTDGLSLRLIYECNNALGRIPTDRGLGHKLNPFTSKILHAFRENTFKAEYAYNYGMPQWLAKLDHPVSFLHLEKLFLGRHKFHHFRIWFRDDLAGYLKDMMLNEEALSRPHINKAAVKRIITEHTRGTGNFTNEIDSLLTIELTYRSLLSD